MKKFVVATLVSIVIVFGVFEILVDQRKEENIIDNVVSQEILEPIPEDITINMTVAGDILCHNTNFWDAYNAKTDTYDFSYSFEDIKKYFDNADISIGTLETNFAGKSVGYSNYPLFNSPEALATDLRELGFDILATANNHCLDKGYNGMVATLNELDKAGIEHMGTYTSEEASQQYLIKDIKGIKMAFLNYTYGTNGIPVPKGKEYAVNLINKDKMKIDIDCVKELGAELVCVNMHWGEEYRLTQTKQQEELADFLFQNGVDLILGSHTHCLEPMEKRKVILEDGTEKEGFVIYSLGNFMSGQKAENSRQSVILDIQITKRGEDGKFSIDKVEYTPIYMFNFYNSRQLKRFKVMDIEAEIEKYDAGDTIIGSTMYNTLKKELQNIYKVLGEEIRKESL